MTKKRRDFLRKSLKIGAVAGASVAVANESLKNCATTLSDDCATDASSGVVCGKAVKKEVLYKKNNLWEHYYKIAH